MGFLGRLNRCVRAVAMTALALACAPLLADEAPMTMDITVDSEVRSGTVLLHDDSLWLYGQVSRQLTGLAAKDPVVTADPHAPTGAPPPTMAPTVVSPAAQEEDPGDGGKSQIAGDAENVENPGDAGDGGSNGNVGDAGKAPDAKDAQANKILVRPKDGASPYRLEVAHKASLTVADHITEYHYVPYSGGGGVDPAYGGYGGSNTGYVGGTRGAGSTSGSGFGRVSGMGSGSGSGSSGSSTGSTYYIDPRKKASPWTWWLSGARTDSLSFRLLKWNGAKYEALRTWNAAPARYQDANILVASGQEVKGGKAKCPLSLREAQQKALDTLNDGARPRLRVPVIEQLTGATMTGAQTDPSGQVVTAGVKVVNRSLWPITEFAVRIRWYGQTKSEVTVKGVARPVTKVGWANFARSVDLKEPLAPGKQVVLTSDPKETGPGGRNDNRGPISISWDDTSRHYTPVMEIIAIRFNPEAAPSPAQGQKPTE